MSRKNSRKGRLTDLSVSAMQIQYNITRIEEWCKSHDMPEGTLQLEHLMQATKLLQLKKVNGSVVVRTYFGPLTALFKATAADIEIIYDVCWMLTPTQIQRMCTNYYVADYEVRQHTACILPIPTDASSRTQYPPKSCASSPPACRRMTGTTTCFFLPRRRRWARTSCRYRARYRGWRRTCRRI